MANIKPIGTSATKYKKNAAAAGPDYKTGIEQTTKDWGALTSASEPAYNSGVQAAISRGAFGKGVNKIGTAGWKKKALAVGPTRYVNGIQVFGENWQPGFQPFQDTINALTLPPKGAKNSPENYARVPAVGNALHAKKLELLG
jgi:hypothetical protein